MEETLSQFSAGSLVIKLTSEKLFINTSTSNETFALRSVNGVGVIDLVEEYNIALTEWKNQQKKSLFSILFGAFILLGAIGMLFDPKTSDKAYMTMGVSIGLIIYGNISRNKIMAEEPILMSAVRIMMSGGNRDFRFDKSGRKSGDIAEFVSKVENTLTAYHKNNP